MHNLATLAKGDSSLHLNGNAQSFTYQGVSGAVAYVNNIAANNPKKKIEIVCAGHSLGGSAVDLFANKINGVQNLEVEGMYYFDAVGYAPSSTPGINHLRDLLGDANAPYIDPEIIAPNVKNFGMMFQRDPLPPPWLYAYGINQYTLTGSTNVQFDMEVLGVNHSTIASNGNDQNAVINAARSDY